MGNYLKTKEKEFKLTTLGFTLIELLAVIVILAIIALILIPMVMLVIEKAKKASFEDSVKISSRQIEMYLFENNLSEIPEDGIKVENLNIKSDFISGTFKEENGVVVADKIRNSEFCASGPITKLIIRKNCTELDTTEPTANILVSTMNSKGIEITAICEDVESGISKIEYSNDNGVTWESNGTNNTYSFSNLEKGLYEVKVRCTNSAKMTTISETVIANVWEKYPTVTLTTEADTVLGQTVTATLLKDENGETPSSSYIVTGTMSNSTVLTLKKIGTYRITANSSDSLASYSNDLVVNYDNNYNIEKYRVRKYLFNYGDISENSGGWGVMWEAAGGTPGTITTGGTVGTMLYLTAGSSYKKDMYPKNTIDLTTWKKLVVECTYHNNIGNGWSAIHLYTPGGYYSEDASMSIGNPIGIGVGTNILDVSSLERKVRIAFLAARTEWRISQVYLEK